MKAGTKVKVIAGPKDWNKAVMAEPQIGLVGKIIENDKWVPPGKVWVEVLSNDMGYLWTRGDDPDRKYISFYIHPECLEVIQ